MILEKLITRTFSQGELLDAVFGTDGTCYCPVVVVVLVAELESQARSPRCVSRIS